jgi:hypothetical protein
VSSIQKPHSRSFDPTRISKRYSWYWRHESLYIPLWDWGADTVAPLGQRRLGLGALESSVTWGRRGSWWGAEFPGGATDANTKGIRFSGAWFDFARNTGVPWTVWVAFQVDDLDNDDNSLINFGTDVQNQLVFRVDRRAGGGNPENMEMVRPAAAAVSVSSAVIAENEPYFATLSHNGTGDANNHTCLVFGLNPPPELLSEQSVSINNNDASRADYRLGLGQRQGGSGFDPPDGIIMAAGVFKNYAISKSEAYLLAHDIYGPIRAVPRIKVRSPVVAITPAQIAATTDTSWETFPPPREPVPIGV